MTLPKLPALLILLPALFLAACRDPSGRRPPMTDEEFRRATTVYGQVQPRPLHESLGAIESWLQEHLRPAARTFNRPRPRSVVQTRFAALGLDLPEEVLALQSWRDGQRAVAEAAFFPEYRLLSAESAVEEYQAMKTQAAEGAVPKGSWLPSYLPILKSANGLVVVVCEGDRTGTVLDWSATTGRGIGHPNIASLMQEIAEGYESGAYFVRDDGSLAFDETKELAIFLKYHPRLLSRRGLSADREVERDVDKHLNGSSSLTLSLVSGAEETREFDKRGLLTSKVVEVNGEPVQEESTEYDDRGRPQVRRIRGFHEETIVWNYGEGENVEIRRTTSAGTRILSARLDGEGKWSVLSTKLDRTLVRPEGLEPPTP